MILIQFKKNYYIILKSPFYTHSAYIEALEQEYFLQILDYSNIKNAENEQIRLKEHDIFTVNTDELYELMNKLQEINSNRDVKIIYLTKKLSDLFEDTYTDAAKKKQNENIQQELNNISNINIDLKLEGSLLANFNRLWEWFIEQELGVDWLYD